MVQFLPFLDFFVIFKWILETRKRALFLLTLLLFYYYHTISFLTQCCFVFWIAEKKVRDKAIKLLANWLARRDDFNEIEMMKVAFYVKRRQFVDR